MSERLRPAATGGIPPKLEATIIEPQTKPGSGRGSGVGIPGTGRSFTPDNTPKRHRSHKLRNLGVAAAVTLGGTGVYVATRGGNEASPTTTAAVTTVDVKPTSPSDPVTTEPSTTDTPTSTTEAPTTTTQPEDLGNSPDAIAEYTIIPVGGVRLDIESQGKVFGFQEGAPDQIAYALLFTFAAQKPEFVNPDNTVNVDGYIEYLKNHNWKDEVMLPKTTGKITDTNTSFPPVVASKSYMLDFTQPFVMSNDEISKTNGGIDTSNTQYYSDLSPHVITMFGISPEGQLYFSSHDYNANGQARPLKINYPGSNWISQSLGEVLAVTSHLGVTEATPEKQALAADDFFDPAMVHPTGRKLSGPLLDITYYGIINPNIGIIDKFFKPIS